MESVESLLSGDYRIIQDTELYRFTSDSVLLSRFLKAKKGERVADFCAGSGIVGLHFFAENRGVEEVVLFEMQPALADLAARTVALNGLGGIFKTENVRIQDIPAAYTEHFTKQSKGEPVSIRRRLRLYHILLTKEESYDGFCG